jgi:hypothetical protein
MLLHVECLVWMLDVDMCMLYVVCCIIINVALFGLIRMRAVKKINFNGNSHNFNEVGDVDDAESNRATSAFNVFTYAIGSRADSLSRESQPLRNSHHRHLMRLLVVLRLLMHHHRLLLNHIGLTGLLNNVTLLLHHTRLGDDSALLAATIALLNDNDNDDNDANDDANRHDNRHNQTRRGRRHEAIHRPAHVNRKARGLRINVIAFAAASALRTRHHLLAHLAADHFAGARAAFEDELAAACVAVGFAPHCHHAVGKTRIASIALTVLEKEKKKKKFQKKKKKKNHFVRSHNGRV